MAILSPRPPVRRLLGKPRRFAGAVATLSLLAALWGSASAQAAPVVGLQAVGVPPKPGYFVLSARPGATLTGTVEVTNTGSAGTVLLDPVDAATGETTGAVYRSRQAPRVDVGRWIQLADSKLSIAAGQMTPVAFRVTIPANASPGQHLGGIVAEPVLPVASHSATRASGRFQVKIRELSVIAVEVDVPGPRVERMAITGIGTGTQSGRQTLELGLANTGDVLLKGSGTLVVSSAGGRKVVSQPFKLDTFVPRTQISYPLVVTGRSLPTGQYRGTITLSYGNGHHLARTVSFSIGSKQLAHLSSANRPPAAASSGDTLLLILAAIGLVLLGVVASAAYFRSQARKAVLKAAGASVEKQAAAEG